MAAPNETTAVVGQQQIEALAAPSEPAVLQPGAQVGRYLVIGKLGEGGMGVVYAAFDPKLDRKVAIKLIQTDGEGQSVVGSAALLLEAQALAKLQHPNVIAVHDVGLLGSGQLFVAMELVEGKTLKAWLNEKKRFPRELLPVLRAAGQGLAAAHKAGLVHRDFKPENVLVGDDGRVRVLDFGLARAPSGLQSTEGSSSDLGASTSRSASVSNFTQLGKVVGTPAYLAPELLELKSADARTDQFAFGVTLYIALYGQRPFKGSPFNRPKETRWKLEDPPKGVGVPSWLRRIAPPRP